MDETTKPIEPYKMKQINELIVTTEKRIKAIVDGVEYKSSSNESDDAETRQNIYNFILFVGYTTLLSLLYGILKLHDASSELWKWAIKVSIFSVTYMLLVTMLHVYIFNVANIKGPLVLLSALMPVLAVFGMIQANPSLSGQLDNTLGYMYLSLFNSGSLTEVMSNFKSSLFPESGINFNWLVTTFDVNTTKRESFKDYIVKTIGTSPKTASEGTGIITDFYMENTDDGETINNLYSLVETKHQVGSFACVYMATVIGLFGSILLATSVK